MGEARIDARQRREVGDFIKAARRLGKGRRHEAPRITPLGSSERLYIENLWQYFTWLSHTRPRREYLTSLNDYESAHQDLFDAKAPTERGRLPLDPESLGFPKEAAPVRRKPSGRPRNEAIQRRNSAIRELLNRRVSDFEVARELDRRGFPTPATWRSPGGPQTWFEVANSRDHEGLVARLFFDVRRRG
jgi:hypothetical protein